MGLFKKINSAVKNTTTYRIGLLQTKTYRALKQETTRLLEPYQITSVHWAFLGLLYDHKEGIRSGDAAHALGVEAPFVSVLFSELAKKSFVETRSDPKDSRAKLICLTGLGRNFVSETEKYLRNEMRPLIKGVSFGDLISYISVLEKIIENSK